MGLNNTQLAIIDDRRLKVAQLLVRGLTQREIIEALTANGSTNPETLDPWSLGTINGDVKALLKQWREEAGQEIETHRARLMAETQAARRVAWAKGDIELVLRGIKVESDLLGAAVPPEVNIRHGATDRKPLTFVEVVRPIDVTAADGDLEQDLDG